MKLDQNSAECFIYTWREGALAAIGHDLKIDVTRFEIDLEARTASFDASSLYVVGAMSHGNVDGRAISDSDKGKINKSIVKDILKTKKFPKIEYKMGEVTASKDEITVNGTLTLVGVKKNFPVTFKPRVDGWVGKVKLDQSDFKIKPFKALLGQLRIKSEIEIELTLPAPQIDAMKW